MPYREKYNSPKFHLNKVTHLCLTPIHAVCYTKDMPRTIFGAAGKPKTCYRKVGAAGKPKTCYRKAGAAGSSRIVVESINRPLNIIDLHKTE